MCKKSRAGHWSQKRGVGGKVNLDGGTVLVLRLIDPTRPLLLVFILLAAAFVAMVLASLLRRD